MLLGPFRAFFLGLGPNVSRDGDRVLLIEFEVRHARARPKLVRVLDPAHHPAGIDFGADFSQARRNFGNILIAFDQMASGAADLFEKPLPFGKERRVLKIFLHVEMARGAARLHFGAAQEGKFPQVYFAVGLFRAVDRDTLPFVTSSATEFTRRMAVVRQQQFSSRVGSEWLRILFKPGPVDRQMASDAAVDPSHRLIEAVAVELVQGNLRILEFIKRERADFDRDVFHHPTHLSRRR